MIAKETTGLRPLFLCDRCTARLLATETGRLPFSVPPLRIVVPLTSRFTARSDIRNSNGASGAFHNFDRLGRARGSGSSGNDFLDFKFGARLASVYFYNLADQEFKILLRTRSSIVRSLRWMRLILGVQS